MVLYFVGVCTLAFLAAGATLAEVRVAYRENLMYDLNSSVVECKQFIQACRFLIDAVKDETRQGSAGLRDNAGKYERALAAAEAWLAVRDVDFGSSSGGGVTYADLSSVRD